jgi:hypothetical protein
MKLFAISREKAVAHGFCQTLALAPEVEALLQDELPLIFTLRLDGLLEAFMEGWRSHGRRGPFPFRRCDGAEPVTVYPVAVRTEDNRQRLLVLSLQPDLAGCGAE